MLGHAVLRVFGNSPGFEVYGVARRAEAIHLLPAALQTRVQAGFDVLDIALLAACFQRVRPQVVINAVGVVKQLAEAKDPVACIELNALLPHRLATLCEQVGARLVQVGTDCVFTGMKGLYTEQDPPDPQDLYGRSKLLGEIDLPHVITLRTSIIGHELDAANSHSLIGWFLNQRGRVPGFTRAVFSGLPTVELSHVIRDYVLPQPDLHGVYHVASEPINKFDLLTLVARTYGIAAEVQPVDQPVIDRSLNASRFRVATGYVAPAWSELVARMERFR
jgi:dTDP-4-dehydrorhamnose reductase